MSTVLRTGSELPPAERTMAPFAIVDDAAGLIRFLEEVFEGRERAEARTPMPDGSLLHAEVELGDSVLLIADRQPGWRHDPALLQVYVRDAREVLDRATARGATVFTEPTAFYGSEDISRVEDPFGNLWWLYSPSSDPGAGAAWESGDTSVLDTLEAHMRGRGEG